MVLDSQKFNIAFVKVCCQEYYGKPIYPNTWLNWKSKVGIRKGVREISYLKFLGLFAIAHIRREDFNKPFNKREHEIIVRDPIFRRTLEAAIEYISYKDFYLGSELPKVLKEEYGISVSIKSFMESIPGFGLNKTYDLKKVLKLLDKEIIVN